MSNTILIVDDSDILRRVLKEFLAKHAGAENFQEASDGRQAILRVQETRPDLIILDLSMPELNGIEATRQIKRALPEVEVLIFTMYDAEEMILSACQAGARGFILKSDDELEIV